MKILLLTQVLPYPPDSGPRVKTYNVIRYLAQKHELTLISFVRSQDELRHVPALQAFCHRVLTVPLHRSRPSDVFALAASVIGGTPFLIKRDEVVAMYELVKRTLGAERFDAIHADQLNMAQFAVDAPVPLRLLDEHNAVWRIVQRAAQLEPWGLRRLLMEREWRRLRVYEGDMCRRFDRVLTVIPQDRLALEAAAGRPFHNTTVPIAIDTEDMQPIERSADASDVVSVATMFYPPNVEGVRWFMQDVFPHVRRAFPQARLVVVGARPPEDMVRMAKDPAGMTVTGYVPDLQPILRTCAAFIVPVRAGSGMRVRILEAFSRGTPVVSTTLGFEGIEAEPGRHLLAADNAEDFALAVSLLLRNRALGDRIAANARQLVEERYDWRRACSGLDEIYRDSPIPATV